MDILDSYLTSEPSNQNILDLFKNEWTSHLPAEHNLTMTPGTSGLFEDPRIEWASSLLGPFKNTNILELGPLEGGHSYMLSSLGANVTAIESNTRAFLKCLCIKEILKLSSIQFRLGDFREFLKSTTDRYDIVIASGVLYHMTEPVELIKNVSKVADKVFLWTHYYDADVLNANSFLKTKYSATGTYTYDGIEYDYATQEYLDALDWSGFCGGSKPTSRWLTKNSILQALTHYGFSRIEISFDEPLHPNGPAFGICAFK